MAQGALTAAAAGEEVVPASGYCALEAQVRELHRLLGKKATKNELLRAILIYEDNDVTLLAIVNAATVDTHNRRLPN